MKCLVNYVDGLIMTRGEIRPEIGDKYYSHLDLYTGGYSTWNETDVINWSYVDNDISYMNTYYVEIDYNPMDTQRLDWVELRKQDIFDDYVLTDQIKDLTIREFIDKQLK